MIEKHITEISPKTVANLASAYLINDAYHRTISRAAKFLASKGRITWTYCTQWGTGTTLWLGAGGQYELVTREELINYGF